MKSRETGNFTGILQRFLSDDALFLQTKVGLISDAADHFHEEILAWMFLIFAAIPFLSTSKVCRLFRYILQYSLSTCN